ncbi:MAG: hypothetical protein K0R77_3310 [Chryseobacterium sp.]|jgi:hypothetical protein|uniref:hypothetical protein n=1 Tax=Chryseobacterium sp. TaxID=1871047 RepID=UPI002629DDC7|nr:hypothetical protein [Chryseobacterium sp.]MDF2554035.1 hypothetical protein [Chryseobacterium sp.]
MITLEQLVEDLDIKQIDEVVGGFSWTTGMFGGPNTSGEGGATDTTNLWNKQIQGGQQDISSSIN